MREKVTSVKEGVIKLLKMRFQEIPEFSVREKGEGEYVDTLLLEGKEVPIFFGRFDNHAVCLEEYGRETDKNSALNTYSFMGKDIPLEEVMLREMYFSEFVLHSRIKAVTAFMSPNAANMVLIMEDGTAANLDLGNSLAPGSMIQCQHRLITSKGAACDRAAGCYATESQLNVFRTDTKAIDTYDDDQVYLYGLNEKDLQTAITVHGIIIGRVDCSGWAEAKERYLAAIAAAYESDKQCKTVYLA